MALAQSRRTPSDSAAQYLSPRASVPPAPDVDLLTDSEDSKMAGEDEDRELLSDSDDDDQALAQEDDYMEDVEDGDPESATSPPLAIITPTPARRPLNLLPDEVVCVCANRAMQGRPKVGKCPTCSRLFHLACQARNSAGRPGWMCLDCTGASLQDVEYDAKYLAYVYKDELRGVAASPAAQEASPSLAPVAESGKTSSVEEILCICPSRFMKVRTRLARCRECKTIAHIPCRARNSAGIPGFMCFDCPGGRLVDVPDQINNARPSRNIATRQAPVKPEAAHRVTKATAATTTRKNSRLAAGLQVCAAQQALEDASGDAARDPSPKRHNLRQRNVPNMKDRPTRAARKPKVIEVQPSPRFKLMHQRLVRKSKEEVIKIPKKEPRIANLHEIFLRRVPTDALWRYYCILPDGIATNSEVLEATEVNFVNYRVEPVIAVPGAWSKEFKFRLGLLLDAATSDGQEIHLSAKQWEVDVGVALRHVRDIAMEVLHHGSYKGKRARLSLLAEVLGLSEKGAWWKGGDTFVGDKES